MKIAINPLKRSWEFETNEGYVADMFKQVLKCFCIEPYEEYIPSYLDFSQVHFMATPKQREQIEYVFRRYLEWKVYYAIY